MQTLDLSSRRESSAMNCLQHLKLKTWLWSLPQLMPIIGTREIGRSLLALEVVVDLLFNYGD